MLVLARSAVFLRATLVSRLRTGRCLTAAFTAASTATSNGTMLEPRAEAILSFWYLWGCNNYPGCVSWSTPAVTLGLSELWATRPRQSILLEGPYVQVQAACCRQDLMLQIPRRLGEDFAQHSVGYLPRDKQDLWFLGGPSLDQVSCPACRLGLRSVELLLLPVAQY